MIHAYDEIYLSNARNVMAVMLDVAVNHWRYSIGDFYHMFLNSVFSKRLEKGDFTVVAGRSGIELAQSVLESHGAEVPSGDIEQSFFRSPEYWAGWALSYYQWYTNISFRTIEEEVPVEDIIFMYSPYHEMDIKAFVDHINEIRSRKRCMTYLKKMRQLKGMTQKKLSDAAGIPLKTLQQYEQGCKNINKAQCEYVISLAKVLHCRPEDLLEH